MRYLLIILILFFSCKNRDRKDDDVTNTLNLQLSDNLPFKEVKLVKFNPLYGTSLPFDYKLLREKDSFKFKFNSNSLAMVHLADENNVGAGEIFLEPGENISTKLFYGNHNIKKENFYGKWPGNNLLFQIIYDSLVEFQKRINSVNIKFNNRKSIDTYVEKFYLESIVKPLIQNDSLQTSTSFKNEILKPEIILQKCFLKNELIKKIGKENKWKKFYADSILLNPDYKFWCLDYNEYSSFTDYLFEVINNSKAIDLRKFIQNIDNAYRSKHDTLLTKIAISQGLNVFSWKYIPDYNDLSLPFVLDSICKANGLDRSKYKFPDFTLSDTRAIEPELFDKILVATIKDSAGIKLKEVINDTSKIYYVDYWASWCHPCVKGLPYTVKLYNQHINHLNVLFLSIDHNRANFLWAATNKKIPASNTYNIIITDQNSDDFKKLNPINQIPVYQLIFWFRRSWHVMNALSSDDPNLIKQINNLKSG